MAHNNLGILLKKQGKPQEAVEHYSEVLRIKPDYVQARDNLHLASQKTGKTNKPATTGERP
jgi:tetratricopeptide (TPR) repeat protein